MPVPRFARFLPILPVCVALSSALFPASAQGETGFLRGKGNTDIVLATTLDTYDEFWVGTDRVAMAGVGEVDRMTYTLYSAYGATDDIDVILGASYVEAEADGAGNFPDESDLQDALLAAKWRVYEHALESGTRFSVALLPGVKLPLSDYEENNVTAIGDGQVDVRARFVSQVHFANGAFIALETGYDRRNGAPDDEFPIHLTLGATVLEGLTLSPFLSRVDSLGGSDIGDPRGFPYNEEDFTRVGLSAYYRLSQRFGLTGSWRTTIDGRNTGDVDGFSLGVVLALR